MKPAKALLGEIQGPVVIIIDALDESGDTDSRRQLLRILAGRLGKAGSRITDLPPQFRILLTSRPLSDICTALQDIPHVRQYSMDSIPRDSAERDIFHYVSTQLSNADARIGDQKICAALAQASCGLFEWARLACAYVRGDGDAGLGLSVRERFDAIVSRNKDKQVPLLDDMYLFTLQAIFRKQRQRDLSLKRFKSAMAQILGTMEPLPLSALDSMRRHFVDGDNWEGTSVSSIIGPMGALLSGTTDPSTTIRPLHASFPEFLTDRDRSGEFFIDVPPIHNHLAFACLGVMNKKLRFNICGLPSSYLRNAEVPDLDQRVKISIPPELMYSCQFWVDHVQNVPFSPPLAEIIRRLFNDERLLFWFEVLAVLKKLNTGSAALTSLIRWTMVSAMTSLIK